MDLIRRVHLVIDGIPTASDRAMRFHFVSSAIQLGERVHELATPLLGGDEHPQVAAAIDELHRRLQTLEARRH